MTRQTGWTGDAPDEAARAMPVTSMLLDMRQRAPGDTLALARARSEADERREAMEAAAAAPDADDYAAALVTRGYTPGLLGQLAQRLGDTTAELEAEREKLEKAARRAEVAAREHAAGRVDVFRMQAMMDGDDGDEGRVRVLERRAESLRRQIGEAQDMVAPRRERQPDALEAAASRAHQAFAEVTRQRWAEAQQGTPSRRAPRPFASRGDAAEPSCAECAATGASAEESFLIHSDPQPVPVPGDVQVVETGAGTWSYDRSRGEMNRVSYR